MRIRNRCGVTDCDQWVDSLGYCGKHAYRFRKHGDPLVVTRPHEPQQGACSVDACETIARSRGLCSKHLARFMKYGDVNFTQRPTWGTDEITYHGAHLRTVSRRGRAALQACVRCQGPARQWAYDHADPDVRTDPDRGWKYSTKPEHYQPMCVPCHKAFDAENGSPEVIHHD